MDIFREGEFSWAFDEAFFLFIERDIVRILKEFEDIVTALRDKVTGERDILTILAGIITASIAGKGMDESTVMREESGGDNIKEAEDFDEEMEDGVIAIFTDTGTEIGEISLTRDAMFKDTGIDSIGVAIKFIMEGFTEILHGREAMKEAEDIAEEKRDGVKAEAAFIRVGVSNKGANEGEIDKRSNQSSTVKVAIGKEFDFAVNIGVEGE